MKLTRIIDYKLGKKIQGFYLCTQKNLLSARNNNFYLDIKLMDSSGEISAKMWDLVDYFNDRFNVGDPVAVKGSVSEYKSDLVLIIKKINLASLEQYSKYGFSENSLIKTVDIPIDKMWNRIIKIVNSINSSLKELVLYVLKKHKRKIQIMPFSIDPYTASGSFLKQILIRSEIAVKILPLYSQLDYDLVLAGIILCDIGKVKSFNNDIIPKYTKEGQLVEYPVLGRDIIIQSGNIFKNIPIEILAKLEHLVLSSSAKNIKGIQCPEEYFINNIYQFDKDLNILFNLF